MDENYATELKKSALGTQLIDSFHLHKDENDFKIMTVELICINCI